MKVLLASLLMLFLMFGCQATDDEDEDDPCVAGSSCETINGIWDYSGYVTENGSGLPKTEYDTFTISQTVCTFNLAASNHPERSGTGTVDGHSVCFNSVSFPDDGGTVTIAKTALTYDGSATISGNSSWTWKDGSSSGEGTTAVTLSADE